MGDLSGGVILGGIAKNALGLDNEGLAFYEFPEIWDKKGFKESYRRVLDTMIDVDQADVNAIVVEANYAFRLNMYMFEEIQGEASVSFRKLVLSALKGFVEEMTYSKRFR